MDTKQENKLYFSMTEDNTSRRNESRASYSLKKCCRQDGTETVVGGNFTFFCNTYILTLSFNRKWSSFRAFRSKHLIYSCL